MSMVWRLLGRHPVWISMIALAVVGAAVSLFPRQTLPPIKVGILHSMTGPLAVTEKPIADATLLAIDRINAAGGVLGRQIEPVIADGESNPSRFAEQAGQLIQRDHVKVIFGCDTPAIRKAVRPLLEKYHQALFYPGPNEGFERSPNIVYMGASPNQHITFAVHWALAHMGHRFYLVGTDSLYPHMANTLIGRYLPLMDGKVVGERYIAPQSRKLRSVVDDISRLRPDVIVSTVEAGDNGALLHALAAAGLGPEKIPFLSLTLSATEAKAIGPDAAGAYVSASYFQDIDTPANRDFVAAFHKMYGQNRVIGSDMEAAYVAVHLWARAVAKSGSDRADIVLQTVRQKSMVAPEGIVSVDYDSGHAWRYARVGRLGRGGKYDIVDSSEAALRPQVVPTILPYDAASRLLIHLYYHWNERWIAPSVVRAAS